MEQDNQEVKPHPRDKPLRSSSGEIRSFKEHPTWMDMRQWLQDRIDILHSHLEHAEDVEEIRRYQGAIKNCRDVLNLPDEFMEELNQKQE